MGHRRLVSVAIAGITALLAGGGLFVTTAPAAQAAQAGQAAAAARALPASSVALPGVVSQSAEKWTPNVFPGTPGQPPSCNTQWFGTGGQCTDSTVWSETVVNGEVIVAGGFTQVCQPGSGPTHCKAGTQVTRNDIFAYQLGTGKIDPNFAPALDQGPVYSVVAGPNNTVYAAGRFTSVNGMAEKGIVQLSVTPSVPSTDGQVVTAFKAKISGTVNSIALNGSSLYAGGSFDSAQSGAPKDHGLARLNAATGAVDTTFSFTLGGPILGAILVQRLAVTPNGSTLAIAGQFMTVDGQSDPRVALINTGGGLGNTATLENWTSPVFNDNCSHQHNWVRGIDFSPDGSYFVIADTGYKSANPSGLSICDAVARFETAGTGSVEPTWVNYAGGDSMFSVAVTGAAVYIGGHDRWINNECGNNSVCEANAVLVNGLAAIDPSTGLALPWWHPQTLRGNGVVSLVDFGPAGGLNGGLLVGTDVNNIGGAYHSENALFPLTSTASSTPGGPIVSGMFSQGRLGGHDETPSGTPAQCVDDAGNSSTSGTAVKLMTCANDAEQNWTIESDGTIQINGLCLDTSGGGTASGTPVVVDTCNGSNTQKWAPGSGNTTLTNQGAPGMCLNAPGTSNVQLQIATCNSSSTAQSWPLPVTQAPPPPPPTGSVYLGENQKSSQVPCLNNAGGNAQIATCVGSPPQQWTMESDGTFQNSSLCLDTAGGGTTSGTLVVVDTCNSSSTQVWAPGPNGGLMNQGAPGMCLTDPESLPTIGTQLQISSCNGGINQHWWLPEV